MAIARSNRQIPLGLERWLGWPGVFAGLVFGSLALFSLFPGTIEGKSLAVLHGLCAQQPAHSYYFGEARLPFDARMTGIYSGFAMTALYLLARGRWRSAGLTDVKLVVVLAAMVLPLAIDGTNSFLMDVELPYLYEPRNIARTLTGLLVGTALASFVWLLVGQTALRRSERTSQPVWGSLGDVSLAVALQLGLVALIGTSWTQLRVPLTFVLMLSAAALITGLLLPFILLIKRKENMAASAWELAGPATLALVFALTFMGVTAGGRFLLEAMLGLPAQVPA
jgi:uncharacterized membrane protein